MSISFRWSATLRRLLTMHLHRLRDFFGNLAQGLRVRLAAAAGEAVAGVLRALLEGDELAYRRSVPNSYPDREMSSWRDEVDEWHDDLRDDYPAEILDTPAQPTSRWRPTLAMALHATAWWLRQPAGGLPGKLAVAATVAASLAAMAGMPVAAVLALAGAVPGLIALADAARDGVEALAQQTLP